eukprot:6195260-Pleurochrysis_carterae.AAC.2
MARQVDVAHLGARVCRDTALVVLSYSTPCLNEKIHQGSSPSTVQIRRQQPSYYDNTVKV